MGKVAKDAIRVIDVEHELALIRDRHVTVALLEFPFDQGGSVQFTGSSKRAPGDPTDNYVGDRLAMARALREAADYFEKTATP